MISRVAEQITGFLRALLGLPHRLFQFFLAIAKAGVNLVVRVIADGVNLWSWRLEWDVHWN